MNDAQRSLVELGRALKAERYRFVTPTPETVRRVRDRSPHPARTLREVFGYSRPFSPDILPPALRALLFASGEVQSTLEGHRATVRFSSLGDDLYVHSAFPTTENDAVFFGPDTYRFCRFLQQNAPAARRVVDIGTGSGAGALCLRARAEKLVLADISARALALAEVNAALAGVECELVSSDVLASVDGNLDLILANPPYMRDPEARLYRDGGGDHGEGLSVRIVREALDRLAPGGTLLVYTGATIVNGQDTFYRQIEPLLRPLEHHYEEIDPDVFGEELETPLYADAERIAAVGLQVHLR